MGLTKDEEYLVSRSIHSGFISVVPSMSKPLKNWETKRDYSKNGLEIDLPRDVLNLNNNEKLWTIKGG